MNYYGNPMTRLIEELAALPGIGGKSAQRLAFHIINLPREKVAALSEAILAAKDEVKYCSVCCNLTEEEICPVCANPKRDHSVIMVVEDPLSALRLAFHFSASSGVRNAVWPFSPLRKKDLVSFPSLPPNPMDTSHALM